MSFAQHKTFQFGDVVVRSSSLIILTLLTASEKANLLGSGIGLYVAYHLEKYYRRRQEVRAHPSSPRPKLTTSQNSLAADLAAVPTPFRVQLISRSRL